MARMAGTPSASCISKTYGKYKEYENCNQNVYDLIVYEMDHGPISSTFEFKLGVNMQEPCRYVWSEIINGMFCIA